MRYLHTSDWHLGMVRLGGVTYEEDQNHALEQIYAMIEKEKIDGVLLAGDVFDKSIASREAIRMYDDAMSKICGEMGIPVHIIAGNHDGAERISQCSDLLKNSGLYITGSLSPEPRVVNNGDVDIYMLPWISTDKVRSVYPDEKDDIDSLEDAYRIVLDHYRESFIDGHKNILIAHAYVRGAETSTSDRAAEIGGATMIDPAIFQGFDYVALGHLHGPQKVTDSIRYSGSLMAYSFGREEDQEKSVTIIDTDDMSISTLPIPQLHRRKTLTGTYEELMEADFTDDILNGYIRLEVTDSFVGVDTMASFRERYVNLIEVAGKDLEKDDSRITMTIEELDSEETDPEIVFTRYCRDIVGEKPDEHLMDLFAKAMEKYGKEAEEE